MLIYHYDEETKEYLASSEAYADPEETKNQGHFVPLIPAFATSIKPLKNQQNKTNVFDIAQQKWSLVSDYRGQYIVNKDMTPEKVKNLGDIPYGYAIITEEQITLLQQYGSDYFIISNGILIINPNYEKDQRAKRKKDFESKFIETSWGWYRKEPKGYSNAPQSIDIIDRLVTKFDGFIDRINVMMIFYEKPDFSDASQCTEDWLVAHQYTHGVCTKQEFENFYVDFQTRWAMNQYK